MVESALNLQARLRITEIFYSLQGETRNTGLPTVFIRLTGCPLRCQYCDTAYAFSGGYWMTLDDILQETQAFNTQYVTVTGGEPLAQPDCHLLLSALCDAGYKVSLETSGALTLKDVDHRVNKIMDLKTPASGESDKNNWDNLQYLTNNDQIKFVICNEQDYLWSKTKLENYKLNQYCEVLFSPSHNEITDARIADWILRDQLAVRYQVQLHKLLWGDEPGR